VDYRVDVPEGRRQADGRFREWMFDDALGAERAVRDARHRTAAMLRCWNCPQEQVDDIVLVVSEVVTNAVQHGAGVVRLRLLRQHTNVRIEVQDDSPRPPVLLTTPSTTADWGRGLRIVGGLAAHWGTHRAGSGKLVWAEVPCGTDLGIDDPAG